MSPDGMGLGLGSGYLQTGPFLDHLAVIKTSHIGTILSTLSALTQQTCSQARMTVWPFFVVSACDPTSVTQVMHRLLTVLKCKM